MEKGYGCWRRVYVQGWKPGRKRKEHSERNME